MTTPIGTANIGQNLGLIEIGAVFRRQQRLNPVVTVGAGALYVRSDGDGVYPYRGIEDSRWTALVDCGLGFVALLGARVALTFEIHASLAAPRPVVRFSGTDAATIGRPALLATWTLMTWL